MAIASLLNRTALAGISNNGFWPVETDRAKSGRFTGFRRG